MIRRFSAGGVVYKKLKVQSSPRVEAGSKLKVNWLLIQPKDTNRWQLPKGQIEKGEDSQKTALREIKEETGVSGKIIDKIGKISWWFVQEGEKIFKTVTFYLVAAQKETNSFDKDEVAQIGWFSYDKACQKLTFKSEKEILEKGKGILDKVRGRKDLFVKLAAVGKSKKVSKSLKDLSKKYKGYLYFI